MCTHVNTMFHMSYDSEMKLIFRFVATSHLRMLHAVKSIFERTYLECSEKGNLFPNALRFGKRMCKMDVATWIKKQRSDFEVHGKVCVA